MQTRTRWDARYRDAGPVGAPSPHLVALAPLLPRSGSAIDLGGGSGRNARWLAARGLVTTVADVSPVGLALAVAAARDWDVTITAQEHDLESNGWPDGRWDLALSSWYFHRPLLRAATAHLTDGGVLVVIQPTVENLSRHERPARPFLVEPGELLDLADAIDLEVLHHHEGWDTEDRHVACLVARRPS